MLIAKSNHMNSLMLLAREIGAKCVLRGNIYLKYPP